MVSFGGCFDALLCFAVLACGPALGHPGGLLGRQEKSRQPVGSGSASALFSEGQVPTLRTGKMTAVSPGQRCLKQDFHRTHYDFFREQNALPHLLQVDTRNSAGHCREWL